MKYLSNLDLTFFRIADLCGVSTTTVQLYLDSYVSLPKPSLPISIGIDELHSKTMSSNDSSYLCILVDNIKRQPFDIIDSRSKKALNKYFSSFSANERKSVLFVTIDMWLPYKEVAAKQFPNAKIAVDPFHVVSNIYRAFTKLRVNIMNNVPYNSDAYYLLKKWNRLLISDTTYLDNEPKYNSRFKRKLNYRAILNMLLDISDSLKVAYQLLSMYRLFNEVATSDNCSVWLDSLISDFHSSNIPAYYECTQMLINWKQEIINSFERPFDDRKLSNALTENINSQIRAYLHLTRGTSNFTRFKKRILLSLNKKIFYSISDRITSDKNFTRKRGKYNKS